MVYIPNSYITDFHIACFYFLWAESEVNACLLLATSADEDDDDNDNIAVCFVSASTTLYWKAQIRMGNKMMMSC